MEPDPKKSDFFPTNHEPYPNFSIGGHNLFHTFLELPPKKRTSSRQIMSLTLISVYQAIFSSILFWSYLWKNQISFPQFMSMNLISESYTEKVWAFLYYSDHSKTTQIFLIFIVFSQQVWVFSLQLENFVSLFFHLKYALEKSIV